MFREPEVNKTSRTGNRAVVIVAAVAAIAQSMTQDDTVDGADGNTAGPVGVSPERREIKVLGHVGAGISGSKMERQSCSDPEPN